MFFYATKLLYKHVRTSTKNNLRMLLVTNGLKHKHNMYIYTLTLTPVSETMLRTAASNGVHPYINPLSHQLRATRGSHGYRHTAGHCTVKFRARHSVTRTS